MKITYKPLWKLLIDRNINKTKFKNTVGLASSTLAKMSKGEQVSMGIILKICNVMNCDLTDVVSIEREAPEVLRNTIHKAFIEAGCLYHIGQQKE